MSVTLMYNAMIPWCSMKMRIRCLVLRVGDAALQCSSHRGACARVRPAVCASGRRLPHYADVTGRAYAPVRTIATRRASGSGRAAGGIYREKCRRAASRARVGALGRPFGS